MTGPEDHRRTAKSSSGNLVVPDKQSAKPIPPGPDSERSSETGADWSIAPRQSSPATGRSEFTLAESGSLDLPSQFERSLEQGKPQVLGHYELVRKVGSGGMGVVFEARDQRTGQSVAIKLLQPHLTFNQSAWLRFQKEARVWQEMQSPKVVRCLEFETLVGQPIIVTEFVQGKSLSSWLEAHGKLSESECLQIFEDVAQGLRAIHAAGVIHRDLKPSNILLELAPDVSRRKSAATIGSAKISDFGLAREIDQSESMALTQARALLGTPRYLAPEQFSDNPDLSAAADLYSLGVTMFQATTGRLPFEHPDLWQLADQHRFLPAPDPQSINSEIGIGLRTILLRLLEKQPEDRYQSAQELLTDLERLRQGQCIWRPLQLVNIPDLAEGKKKGGQTTEFRWELESSIEALWPLVTQTNRVNRAMGLPAPQFVLQPTGAAYTHDTKANLKGMTLHWKEYPFCWIENRMMSVLREFHNGPYRFVISEVELAPRIEGGTLLIHKFHYHCRNAIGRWIARWQIGKSTFRSLDSIYRGLDAHCQSKSNQTSIADGFKIPAKLAADHRNGLKQLNQFLIEQNVSDSIRVKLEELILEGTDDELSRMRVHRLAQRWKLGEQEVLRALVLACQAGALKLSWEVICPKCRAASSQRSQLTKIREHEDCDVCQFDFAIDFARNVELVFEVSPKLREVARQKWCIGGPFHAPHVAAQLYLRPNQTVVLRTSLASGDFELTNPQTDLKIPISVREPVFEKEPQRSLNLKLGSNQQPNHIPVLASGRQRLTLANQSESTLLVRLEKVIRRQDVMTAAEAATYRVFRDVFPHEIVSPQTLLSLDHACFLAIKWNRSVTSNFVDAKEPFDMMALVSQELVPRIHRSAGDLIDLGDGFLLAMFRDDHSGQACHRELSDYCSLPHERLSQVPIGFNLKAGAVVVSHLLGFPKYLGPTIDAVSDFEVRE